MRGGGDMLDNVQYNCRKMCPIVWVRCGRGGNMCVRVCNHRDRTVSGALWSSVAVERMYGFEV